jgi:hypothetical protein
MGNHLILPKLGMDYGLIITITSHMKQTMTKRQSLFVIALALVVNGVAAKFRAVKEKIIPVGYQDETGFHYGVKPR